jgi:hypothetical protein
MLGCWIVNSWRIYNNLLIDLLKHMTFVFSLYGIWERFAACSYVRGVGVICPPGKHHSENIFFGPKAEKYVFVLKCSDLGPTGSNTCFLPPRTPAIVVPVHGLVFGCLHFCVGRAVVL